MDLKLKTKLLFNLLKKKNIMLCSIESCTGGLFANTITSIPGASDFFEFGLVTYSNHSKMKFAKVSKKDLDDFGAVSEKVCLAMSRNILKSSLSKKCLSIACTGIAGPKGGTSTKPVGTLFISIASNADSYVIKKNYKNLTRKQFQVKTVFLMIESLINIIKNI